MSTNAESTQHYDGGVGPAIRIGSSPSGSKSNKTHRKGPGNRATRQSRKHLTVVPQELEVAEVAAEAEKPTKTIQQPEPERPVTAAPESESQQVSREQKLDEWEVQLDALRQQTAKDNPFGLKALDGRYRQLYEQPIAVSVRDTTEHSAKPIGRERALKSLERQLLGSAKDYIERKQAKEAGRKAELQQAVRASSPPPVKHAPSERKNFSPEKKERKKQERGQTRVSRRSGTKSAQRNKGGQQPKR